jgi:hypothetical protein
VSAENAADQIATALDVSLRLPTKIKVRISGLQSTSDTSQPPTTEIIEVDPTDYVYDLLKVLNEKGKSPNPNELISHLNVQR